MGRLTSKKKPKPEQEPQEPEHPKLHEPNLNASAPKRGILKNKSDAKLYSNSKAYPTSDDIDESLRNAQKNSSLNQSINVSSNSLITFESPQSDNALNKKQKDLKWDEQNLQKNEDEKVPR